ncbi:cation-translocating P-type ATPase [Desulfobotulus sp. H1]|uniref:P-type Zn(2+) transporter n=1 Tax=Desulfobotulus pelophilus TaxID=2823377 RepID=A0ABT3N7F1_9BACT|nr:cation-translocating P-type ATPase [Desulfobotulus pelophilus]MCW7753380.1 cation-translocating P-type ATPase [Desulfobotulus pelophilus]
MIGRFARLGVYEDLLQSKDFMKLGMGALLAFAGFLLSEFMPEYPVVAQGLILISVAINGLPVIAGAVKGLMEKKVNVDELVSLAILACLVSGEFLTAAVVSCIMVLGSLVEEMTAASARRSIQALVKVSPLHATVVRGNHEERVPVESVRAGDHLIIRPGEQIPVDGLVIRGLSAVDQSVITGEAIPVEKKADDFLYAGTMNQNGVLWMRTEKVGQDTTLGQVIRLVEKAEAARPETVPFIDRFARYFTPLVLLCAIAAWVITGDATRAVAVLIVGCPCALILAVPTATVAAIGRAARAGILVKDGVHMEAVGRVDILVFDKTGTLTEGRPRVKTLITAEGVAPEHLLQMAASVENHASHPLAGAVLRAAEEAGIIVSPADNPGMVPGLGVQGQVDGVLVEVGSAGFCGGMSAVPEGLKGPLEAAMQEGSTPLMVWKEKKALGMICVADRVRHGVAETITELKEAGIQHIAVLSGDHAASVERVGKETGIRILWSGLKPEEKLEQILTLKGEKGRVVFVGDGINDAPALAAADTGIAMGAMGTEVALETADIALMGDDISRLPFLIHLSRRMMGVIRFNIAFALIFNILAVFASGAGLITPIMGAVVHNVGSVLVVLSSASLGFLAEKKGNTFRGSSFPNRKPV